MTYRDDRDALKGRIDELEAKSHSLAEEIARTSQEREEHADLKEAFNRAQAELDRLRAPIPRRSNGGAGLVLFVLVGGGLILSAVSRTRPPNSFPPPLKLEVPPIVMPIQSAPSVDLSRLTATTVKRDFEVRIQSSNQPLFPRGTRCTLTVESEPLAILVTPNEVSLTCDGMALYRVEGVELPSDAKVASSRDAEGVPHLSFRDLAERGEQKTSLTFDSQARTGRVESKSKPLSLSFVFAD